MTDLTKLKPGTLFARDFKIVKRLKQGGMGTVYVAEQVSTGRQRALKLLSPEFFENDDLRERFIREAKVAANIESDHVVEIVTAGIDDETSAPYLVMELLRGEELADAAKRTGLLTAADVAEVYSQIGHALEQAHAQGLVHRDLKPENIYLAASKRRDVSYTAKVLDFGIAKLVADGMHKTGTQPLGSPLYMSPEQTDRKGRICPATDVWGLGLIAFFLLVGKPFWLEEDSLPSLLREICVDPIPRASERVKELGLDVTLPPGFDEWFARCVDRDIDKRFQEAGDCVRAFAVVAASSPAPRKLEMIPGATAPMSRLSSIADPPSIVSAAEARAANTAGNTGVAVRDATQAPARSSLPLYLGAALGAGLLAGGVYFLVVKPPAEPKAAASETASAPSPSGSAAMAVPASASVAPVALPPDPRCPAGMVFHPAGKTFMGSRTLPEAAGANVDGRKVQLSAFCLDATEVTVRAYEACVGEGACERTPDNIDYSGITEEARKLFVPFCNARKPDRTDHPINCLGFKMAETYCKHRGVRLPTEAEWEFAARGPGQNEFPWGNEAADATRLNAAGAEYKRWGGEHSNDAPTMYAGDDKWVGTAPVGSFPAGKSAYGVFDLAGNVWEWTQDWYAPYAAGDFMDPKGPDTGTERAIRGGAFNGSDPQWANPAWRYRSLPDRYSHAVGFRCASGPKAP